MLGGPLQRFPSQVQPIKPGIARFQMGHDAQGLRVMVEPAIGFHRRIQRIFPRMAEGRMAQIMRQRQSLGQILIQAQQPRDGPRNLRNFKGMGQARSAMIALMINTPVLLGFQAPECGVEAYAVTAVLKWCPPLSAPSPVKSVRSRLPTRLPRGP